MDPILDHFEEEQTRKKAGSFQTRHKIIAWVLLSTANPILVMLLDEPYRFWEGVAWVSLYWILGTALWGMIYLLLVIFASIFGAMVESYSDRWAYPLNNFVEVLPFDIFLLGANLVVLCLLILVVIIRNYA